MNDTSLLGLIQNSALLLAVAFIFDVATSRLRVKQSALWQALVGLALGAIGITVMLTPWTFGLGIVFDTRSVLLGISGLFFGFIPTAIVMAMTSAFRFYQGGTGALTGIAVILTSGAIGIVWHYFRHRSLAEISWQEFYLFGMVIHLAMLGLMFTLPWMTALRVLSNIALPVMLIYPVGTALLGVLMVNRLRRERMDEALKESEKKYRLLADNVHDVIFVLDMNLKYTYVSPSVKIMRGYEPEEVLKQSFTDILTPSSIDLAMKTLSDIMEQEKIKHLDSTDSRTIQLEMRRKDGSTLWTEVKFSFIRDKDHRPVSILGLTRDITERKRAEELLLEKEKKYRLVVDNMADVISIIDMNLCFTYVSPSIIHLRGYTVEEVLAQTFEQVMTPESLKIIYKVFEEEMKLEASGAADPDRSRILELEEYKKDGSIVWIENHLSFLRDEAQKIVGIISLSRDITDRKRAEDELKNSEKKYRELYDFLPIPVYEMDFNANITSANRAIYETFRGTEEDLKKGFKGWQLLSPEDVAKSSKNIERMLNGEQIKGTEYTLMRLDGSVFPGIVISSIIYSNGKPAGLRGAIVDITERKKADEALKQTLESLRKAVGATIQVMVSAVEMRDPYTAGHQLRVANLACDIATEMRLPQDKIDGLRMAGSIHDIGKLSIPAEILSKPTKLTNIEFSLIKEHSQNGYDMLKNVESHWPLAQIVYQHHERMNGTGYPRNLKGDEILLEARILAVADVVEAMASHRPYRAALGIKVALEEIEKNKGIFYDDVVVDACLKLFREKGYQLT